jgi:hypothetical protein
MVRLSELQETGRDKVGSMLAEKLFQTGIRGLALQEIPVTITFEDKNSASKTFNQLQSMSKSPSGRSQLIASEMLAEGPVRKPISMLRSTSLEGVEPHPNENLIRGLSLNDFSEVFGIGETIGAMSLPESIKAMDKRVSSSGTTEARNLSIVNSISVWLPYSTALGLIHQKNPKSDEIKKVDLDFEVKALMERTESHLGVPALWNASPKSTGEDIVVGVLDTGIFATETPNGITETHPDFEGKILGIMDFTGSDPKGTLTDSTSHCTHVVGSICGSGRASNGRFKGMAPDAKAYVGKVLKVDANGEGTGLESWIIDAIQWAVKSNVDIINLSLGGPQPNDGLDLLSRAVNSACDEGVIVCVAAGNWGPKTIGTPGSAERAITVGSVSLEDRLSDFSSTGPISASYKKPDVLAPGEDIISTLARGFKYFYPRFGSSKPSLDPELQNSYTFKTGTSMATPIVAGGVALLLDAYFKKYGTGDRRSKGLVLKVRDALINTAKDIGMSPDEQGHGVIQLSNAIAKLTETIDIKTISNIAIAPKGECGYTYDDLKGMLTTMNSRLQTLPPQAIQIDREIRNLVAQLLGNKENITQASAQINDLWQRYNQVAQLGAASASSGQASVAEASQGSGRTYH